MVNQLALANLMSKLFLHQEHSLFLHLYDQWKWKSLVVVAAAVVVHLPHQVQVVAAAAELIIAKR
jgi:hypothetical protein